MSWDNDYDYKNHVLAVAREVGGHSKCPTNSAGPVAQVISFLSDLPEYAVAREHLILGNPQALGFRICGERFELRTIAAFTEGLPGTKYENHRPYRMALFKVRRRVRWWKAPKLVYLTQFSTPEQWNEAAAGLLHATIERPGTITLNPIKGWWDTHVFRR